MIPIPQSDISQEHVERDSDSLFDRLEQKAREINARLEELSIALAMDVERPRLNSDSSQRPLSLLEAVESNAVVGGSFIAGGDLTVAGVIRGDLYCKGTLFITEQGFVQASVTAAEVIVAGRLEGEVNCPGRLLIRATGCVNGIVAAGIAVLEPGAQFAGELRVAHISEQKSVSRETTAGSPPEKAWSERAHETHDIYPSLSSSHSGLEGVSRIQPSKGDSRFNQIRTYSVNSRRLARQSKRLRGSPAGMAYARSVSEILSNGSKQTLRQITKNGKRTGRPRVSDREGFEGRFTTVLERLKRGEISHRGAARELNIGHATLLRLLRQENGPS
jgi:cytoskeletal protein CcmA (bactofilin family)